jgi:threonine dehydrogenase-like Zn-dependent dehydrogenase
MALAVLGPAVVWAGDDAGNVRLVHNMERFAVARALGGAARTLGRAECQAVLDEFTDTSGRPLRVALEASGVSAPEYLSRIFFYDAPPSACRSSELAVTMPGSRAILVCGSRFARQMGRSSRHAEAILIHEALHSLGLGENPPSSDEITERIRARCALP